MNQAFQVFQRTLCSVTVLSLLLLPGIGCGGDATPSVRPDRAPSTDPSRRFRDSHLLRYIRDGQVQDGNPFYQEFQELADVECRYRTYVAENGSGNGFEENGDPPVCGFPGAEIPDNYCGAALCELVANSCRANLAMELAQSTGRVTWLAWRPENERITWLVQTTTDRAYAANEAMLSIGRLEDFAGTHGPGGFATATDCGNTVWGAPPQTETILDRIGAELADQYVLFGEATRARARYLSATADASITGRWSSEGLAGMVRGDQLRRVGASGFVPLLMHWGTSTPPEFCPTLPEDASTVAAIRVIRLSAIDPALLRSDIEGAPTLRAFGNAVMARVSRQRGLFQPDTTLEVFLQREGTDMEGLAAARARLAAEVEVLHRSPTQLLPAQLPTFEEDPMDFDRRMFASTASAPEAYATPANLLSVLDPLLGETPFWWESRGQMLRDDAEWGGADWAPTILNLAQVFHEVGAVFIAQGGAVADPELAANFDAIGRRTQRLAGLDLAGTVVVGTTFFDINEESFLAGKVSAAYSGTELVLVSSVDAAQCATTGRVEGVPCAWANVAPALARPISMAEYAVNDPTYPEGAPNQAAYAAAHADRQFLQWVPAPPAVDWEELRDADPAFIAPRPLFILQRKPGASALSPGAYRIWNVVYQLFNREYDPEDDEFTTGYRYVASENLFADASSLVAPNPLDCSRPIEFCAATGLETGRRIALENELTDDGNATENSWQRYLQLARAAADQADSLGQAAQADLQVIDERAESAATRLESICGVTIDPDVLVDALSSPTASPLDALASSNDPNAARIVRCLGGERVRGMVGLGTAPLCLFHPAGRPWELCEPDEPYGEDDTPPECPRVVAAAADCSPQLFGLPGIETVSVDTDDLLKLFSYTAGGGGGNASNPGLCSNVRRLRTLVESGSPPSSELIASIMDADFFVPGNLDDIARNIRWEAEPQSYSTVYVEETAVLSTGSPWGRAPFRVVSEIPAYCPAPDGTNPSADEAGSLFCLQTQVRNVSNRNAVNGRLAGAATIARWLGGQSYEGFVVPYVEQNIPARDNRTGTVYRLSQDTNGAAPAPQWLVQYSPRRNNGANETITCSDRAGAGNVGDGLVWEWRVQYPGEDPWERLRADGTWRAECDIAGTQHGITFERLTGERVYGADGEIRDVERDVDRRRAALFLERMNVAATDPLSLWGQLNAVAGGDVQRIMTACHEYNAGNQLLQARDCYQQDDGGGKTRPMWIDGDDHATVNGSVRLLANYQVPEKPGLYPYVGGEDIHHRTLFDAMELLCEAGLSGVGDVQFSSSIDEVHSIDDVFIVEQKLKRMATRYRNLGSRVVLTDVPEDVFRALSETGVAVGVVPDGSYGASLASARNALVSMASLPDELASEIDGMARDIRAVRDEVRRLDLGNELAKNRLASTISGQMARCLGSVAGSVGLGRAFNWGKGAETAIQCGDAMAQIALAARNFALEGQVNQLDQGLALLRFEEKAAQRSARVTAVGRRLLEGTNALNAALTNLESLRLDGRRALEQMAFVWSGEADRSYYANTTMRRRYNTSSERYARAHERAIQSAYLARLAIEQRIGADLNSFGDDLTLVEAPAIWADSLCATVGFDAERLRDPSDPDFNSYADAYVGEYVSKLERFMASYSDDYPFGGGSDTTLVSLRDDVFGTQAWCEAETRNLLYQTEDLRVPTTDPSGAYGWTATGCLESGTTEPLPNCVTVSSLGGATDSVGAGTLTMPPMRLTFGMHCVDGMADGVACGWQPGVRYAQTVAGTVSGRHRVSWYGRGAAADQVVVLRNLQSGALVPTDMVYVSDELDNGWRHFWFEVVPATPVQLSVEVGPPAEVEGAEVDIVGLMLERGPANGWDGAEPHFQPTGATRTMPMQSCEDTDGQYFRQQGWSRHCRQVCPGGTSSSCAPGEGYNECYWETRFDITERDIARGAVFGLGGFARGNFNYRMGSFALNFVGSAARTCEDSSRPSTCYNAGFIHYSVEHEGPYLVENYFGDSYAAPLFTGRINYARGLAAERYLSNPLLGNDQTSISQYMRNELRGRPLIGTYRIRVIDEPGVNFEGIEDVQLVIGYQYWTRQN